MPVTAKDRGTTTSGLLRQSNHYMWGLAHKFAPSARVAPVWARAARPYPSGTYGDTVGTTESLGPRGAEGGRFPAGRAPGGRLSPAPAPPARGPLATGTDPRGSTPRR
ncbi:hypothetical protein GCM10010515_43300 [Streptomyces fructofermentans]|uniref:Uncharacterized protein n=1 Tax=Streptomyces fructofermentans TaxID=152141 RepID=A0A918KRV1_9ACTN|nr:hypothetical protein GCM10010515_43300 [Streptomyces fructofermentans]